MLEGVEVDLHLTATFRPGRTKHADLQSLVRARLLERAAGISVRYGADDVLAARAAINAELGLPRDCADGCYRALMAKAELTVTAAAARATADHRRDLAHIARLRYLRDIMYADPALLVIEYLDRNPGKPIDQALIRHYQAAADQLQQGREWWAPVRVAWTELAAKTSASPAETKHAMDILLDTIRSLDKRLAGRHSLPPSVE